MNLLKRKSMIIILTSILLVLMLGGCQSKKDVKIRVLGKEYTEQYLLANIISIMIEENTDLKTDVKINITTKIAFDAIKADEIDVYAEYTGSGLLHLGLEPRSGSKEVYELVKKEYASKYNIKWLDPLGFSNTYAMMVTKETATKYNLKTVSDLAKVASELVMGCPYAFIERTDGYPGLKKHYNFEFLDVKGMETALMYQALVQKNVDIIPGYTTDGRIAAFDLAVLEDDKDFFPPYDAAIIIREEVLQNHPEIEMVLDKLSGVITEEKMMKLNGAVDLEKREIEDVAREFLINENLINP